MPIQSIWSTPGLGINTFKIRHFTRLTVKGILLYLDNYGEVRRAHGCGAKVMGCFFLLIGRVFWQRRVVAVVAVQEMPCIGGRIT